MLETPPHQKETRHGSNSTALVFVSLYFLLLAFFIYLNSISVPTEERIRDVIGSVDVAFKGNDVSHPVSMQNTIEGADLGISRFHAQLRQVYEASIPLVENEVNEEGDQLQFRIPISQLFARGDFQYRENREELFDATAQILIKRGNVEPTDMEILIDTGNTLPNGDEIKGNLEVKRISTIVNAFVERGVASRNVFIGLSEEGTEMVTFKFYVRKTFQNLFVKEAGK
jgi:hypothetical protein